MSHPGRPMAKPTSAPLCLAPCNDSADRIKAAAVRLCFVWRVGETGDPSVAQFAHAQVSTSVESEKHNEGEPIWERSS